MLSPELLPPICTDNQHSRIMKGNRHLFWYGVDVDIAWVLIWRQFRHGVFYFTNGCFPFDLFLYFYNEQDEVGYALLGSKGNE
jgi:hypothetical protein